MSDVCHLDYLLSSIIQNLAHGPGFFTNYHPVYLNIMTELSGRIERIIYTSEETDYTVAKIRVDGERDLVTVVGNIIGPNPGETLVIEGEWGMHPKFGRQFKAAGYRTIVPSTVHGIKKYLGSGLIRGIGPVMAERIVNKFGENALEIIENRIERLTEVEGIGKKRILMITTAWDEQKDIREVMLFLQSHGVGTGYASKIFKKYGNSAISVMNKNPYRVASDVPGIGFLTADGIAEKLGFSKDSPERIRAGIIYMLHQFADEGHVYYPYEPLISECGKILRVDRETIVSAIHDIRAEQKIIIEDLRLSFPELKETGKAVFLEKYHIFETGISQRLKKLMGSAKSIRKIQVERAIDWVQEHLDIILADKQVDAVRNSIQSKMLIITGGPGTGKTTIINAVLKIYSRLNVKALLAAPTGRAAKRMSETTGREAKTIHRLLEFSMTSGGFQRNRDKPLESDLLIIDEASMIDTVLMYHLLAAVPDHTTLVIVGDVHQLPSVGPGNVLKDVIASGAVPVIELIEIFRQARKSSIIVNAHRVNNGDMLPKETYGHSDDFYFIEQEDPERALAIILELVGSRIPKRFGLNPIEDIQVLAPMHRGVAGAGNLNLELQKALNPEEPGVSPGPHAFRINDKVMQIKNNYDKDVFNGDIGSIVSIHPVKQEVVIRFDNRKLVYDFSELDEIIFAYAITVHKSQGSEYPAVVIPILTQHYILLQRNLIYTAMTRGRQLVIIVGSRKALAMGIKNDKPRKRYTYLRYRLG